MLKQFHIVTSILAILFVVSAGCGKKPAEGCADGCKETGAEVSGHGEERPDGHKVSVSFEERMQSKCEHNVPIYQCNECRYEAGVVKLDSSILKKADGTGLVKTQAVARTKVSLTLSVTGEIALNENAAVHISPRISGIIESVAVDIGARVKAGDTLFTMISVELGRALIGYERNRTLAYEQHRTELKASEQTLHVLGLTEDDLEGLKEPLHGTGVGKLPVRAPITGTIIQKHAVAGEMAEPGKDVMLLADLSTVWVWVDLHAGDLPQLIEAEKLGAVSVDITVSALPDKQFKGTITYIGATMNEKTRTVKVRATVGNPDLILRPGMFCEAAISIGSRKADDVLAVPRDALFSDEGKSFVFKHWKDDFFVRQDVRKGRDFHGAVEICAGLQAGELIVTDGAFLLKSDVLREKMGAGCAD